MKVRVINPFNDAHTKKYRNIGDEMEISKERYEEIKKAGKYVVEVRAEEKETKAKTTKKVVTKAEEKESEA